MANRHISSQFASLFDTREEVELALVTYNEMMADATVAYDCAKLLVLANHEGYRMDVLKDLVGKRMRYEWSSSQHRYAVDIACRNMPRMMELLASRNDGEETIAPVVDKLEEPGSRQATASELNPLYGMF